VTRQLVNRRGRQGGFTLVELLVIVLILGLIGAAALATFSSGSEALGRVDDDIRGQQDLKIVTEELTRDVRAGRGVYETSDASSLSIWIDEDADYITDATEIIIWNVVVNASDPGHFDVTRQEGTSGTPRTVGRAVIDALAFKYFKDVGGTSTQIVPNGNPAVLNPSLEESSVVEVSMTYDAIVGAYLDQKVNTYRIRLRNTA
jgi:type II secretory pathway pseudopilin PulG